VYGPDLVGFPLFGPQYYRRLFEDCGTEAEESVVVDESSERVEWVMEAGAFAILVSPGGPAPNVHCPVISSLAELPPLLQTLVAP
jgi:FMN phosphatase YigB (HAD superfamily)